MFEFLKNPFSKTPAAAPATVAPPAPQYFTPPTQQQTFSPPQQSYIPSQQAYMPPTYVTQAAPKSAASGIVGKILTMPLLMMSILALILGLFAMLINKTVGMVISGISMAFVMFGMYNLTK